MLNTSLFASLVSSDLLLYSCIKCFTKDYLTVLNKEFYFSLSLYLRKCQGVRR